MSMREYNRIAKFYAADPKPISAQAHANRIAREQGIDKSRVTFRLEDMQDGGYLHLFVDGREVMMLGPSDVKRG